MEASLEHANPFFHRCDAPGGGRRKWEEVFGVGEKYQKMPDLHPRISGDRS